MHVSFMSLRLALPMIKLCLQLARMLKISRRLNTKAKNKQRYTLLRTILLRHGYCTKNYVVFLHSSQVGQRSMFYLVVARIYQKNFQPNGPWLKQSHLLLFIPFRRQFVFYLETNCKLEISRTNQFKSSIGLCLT
jgi:hypothetical protein